MPNYRRSNTKGGTYFFTVVTFRRRTILCDKAFRASLREAIQITRKTHPFDIDAWVLLPDHLHCVWTLPPEDANFSVRWAMIKRHVSKQCGDLYDDKSLMSASRIKRHESTLWQRRFWEHQIMDDIDYQKHIDYLHYNPVKHGHVSMVKDWPFSSFLQCVKKGVYPENWGGVVEQKSEGDFGEPQ